MTTTLALSGIWAFLIGVSIMVPAMRLCSRLGWIDQPDDRKRHVGAVPIAGGAVIMLSLVTSAVMFDLTLDRPGLIAAVGLLFLVGFYDDRYPMRARYRFGCHLGAASLVALADHTVVWYLGHAFGPIPTALGIFAIPFTIAAIAGVINAFNMIDGADGLAAGQGLIAAFWLITAAAAVPLIGTPGTALQELAPVLLPLAGALAAFLTFNMRTPWRSRAVVFLGDGGSTVIGLLLTWAAIRLANFYSVDGVGTASMVWIFAIPLIDMFATILRRLLDRQTLSDADRKHMHHLLMARGFSTEQAVLMMNMAGFVCGFIGIAGWMAEVPQFVLFWSLIALFLVWFMHMRRFWRRYDAETARSRKLQPI